MTATEIETFRQQLDETERLAKEARGEEWDLDAGFVFGADSADEIWSNIGSPTNTGDAVGEHIARHDPAWALRWVAAAREILAQYERALKGTKEHPDDFALKGALLALHGAVRALMSVYPPEVPR